MESGKEQSKKKKKKPLYILLAFLVFFGLFVYFLIHNSGSGNEMLNTIENCTNTEEVKQIWENCKKKNLAKKKKEQIGIALRNKLESFNLSEDQIEECKKWIPKAPLFINVIVVPDLSRRIIQEDVNPHQIENDKLVFQAIRSTFETYTKFKEDTKDRLIVDVTDKDQAPVLDRIANNLQYDLATHKGKPNKHYFTEERRRQFLVSIDQLYASAKQHPLGADYRFYIKRYLTDRLKPNSIKENFINKVIIITDGYLEATGKPADTKLYNPGLYEKLKKSVEEHNTLQVITAEKLNIPAEEDVDLSNTEVLVCEVNERKKGNGIGYDYDILKTYWKDWFGRMHVKKFDFKERKSSSNETVQLIDNFINQ